VLDDVRFQFSDLDVREALTRLKSSYLSKCFDETPSLKNLVYYNKNAGTLTIEDPRLAFYLRNMSWPSFIERTGHQNARIDSAGKLVFSKRRASDRPAEAERFINVLHLSDLHFSHVQQADVWYGQLAEDLRELECDRLDVLVLSGDLTQRAGKTEFEAARRFLLRLSTDMRLSPGQVVVVPGNHDLSWPLSEAAYSLHRRAEYTGVLEEGHYFAHGPNVIEARNEAAYKKRFEPFSEFYVQIKGTPYSLEYEAQVDVQDFPKENLLFVGLNSAWETDHYFKGRASIHPEALARALEQIRRKSVYAKRTKIAVWHHPLASPDEDRIKDHGFMQQLAKAGFRIVLHGHIHKAERALFRYDVVPDRRRVELVAAGTFGAPTREWVPGYPAGYNLLRIGNNRVVVETRRREEPNGAWQPDARWLQGPKKDPLPRYEIELDTASPKSSSRPEPE
jgi:3',5'-cyclic AMP phosphodiesterase CpdA